jgi:protease IV
MGNFFKIFFASLLAFVAFIGIAIFFIIVAGASAGSKEGPSLKNNSVLTLDVSDAIKEQTISEQFSLAGQSDGQNGLQDMKDAIAKAKTDANVKGIYIKLGMCGNGWATLLDMRKSLLDFKISKKFIYAYGDYTDQKSLYLASVADSIFVNPIGAVELKGLSATGTFYKKALDKLEVTPVVFYCGKFKGASEPYRLEKFSEPNKQQINDLLKDFYAEFISALATKSGKDTAYISALANDLKIEKPSDAVTEHLIDGIKNEHEFLALLKNKTEKKEKDKLASMTMADYASIINNSNNSKNKIAVLYADGEIVDGEGDQGMVAAKPMIREIRKLVNKDDVKAVVLRINSPGGSALASENMYQELMQLRKKKPIIISMGDVAASGGYYLSCAGDSIFAQPNTVTGSIGVVGMMLNFENFMKNKVGITTDVVKTNTHADFPTVTRALTEKEMAYMQMNTDRIYGIFKQRVMDARKISQSFADSIAQGHVYSGKHAMDIKLVDGLGGMDRALQSAAAIAKLKDYKVVYYPAVKDGVEAIVEKLMGKKNTDVILKEALGEDFVVFKKLQSLKTNMDKINLMMPFTLVIK